jgi:hypothetical protein
MDWKKLKYLIILLCPFTEYTNLIRNTRDATINHSWNIYNTLFDHLDMIRDKFHHKDPKKTPWISEFITAIDTSTEKLKEYYSKTGGPVCRTVCRHRPRIGPEPVPGQHPVLRGGIGGLAQYTDISHESALNWVWFGPGPVLAQHPILGGGIGGLRQIGADLHYDPNSLALV